MNILSLNCGSSSLKYCLYDLPGMVEKARGEAQRVGPPTERPSRLVHRAGGRELVREVPMADHAAAFAEVMKQLAQEPDALPGAIGHRVVHGGHEFSAPTVVTLAVMERLWALKDLAPIHNPPAFRLMDACMKLHPDLPGVAVFDTAYHATIPAAARTLALPRALTAQLGLRKFGFHGTSHQFVVEEAARLLGRPLAKFNAVSCHLGSGGASLCAVAGGRSVDNTMGFSPLQGLVMSTRCGDLDPAVTMRLLHLHGGQAGPADRQLNNKSGVLGLSGVSADIRDVLGRLGDSGAAADPRMERTAQVYLWRIRKYLGAYLAVVGRADAIVFTDTIGETMPSVRWAVCSGLEAFGVRLDAARNENPGPLPADVAAADSRVRVLAIATNEELAIARRTYEALAAAAAPAGVAK